jgi:DNA-binding NtrC family response regulator
MSKIAIIDPNEIVRGSLKTVLNAHGHNACSFDTSNLFYTRHKESDFDVLLVDMDALYLPLLQIQTWATTQSTNKSKITLMCGWKTEAELSSMLVGTGILFLSKPFSQKNLLEIVNLHQSDDSTELAI